MTTATGNVPAPALRKAERPADGRAIDAAIARARATLALQERGAMPKPPKMRSYPRRVRLAERLLEWLDTRFGLARSDTPPDRLLRLHFVAVAAARVATAQFARLGGWSAARAVAAARARHHIERLRPVAGYATSSEPEAPTVRAAMLLRLLRRPLAAFDLLVARSRTTLPQEETRRLLAAALREAGEAKVAPAVDPLQETAETKPARRRGGAAPSGLRYGIVMTTLIDSAIFRRSLQSLVESDFAGEIVIVEDAAEPGEACRAAAEAAGADYVKCREWRGSADAINRGIERLDGRVDIVVFCHNDVLWPGRWFGALDRAWNRVYHTGKVSLLNLGYIQLKRTTDPWLFEWFLRGRYDDLAWILRGMRDIPELQGHVQDAQVYPGQHPFGLARDPWIDHVPSLRFQSGRFSVGASFPLETWREIGGFDPDLIYAFDLQLLQHSIATRRWTLFVDTPPLVHLKSTDTRAVSPERQAEIGRKFAQMYETFQQKYGWHIEHFLNLYFSETAVVHQDAIVAAANRGRFEDVDFVFDDFAARLEARRLHNCELTWCRTRAQCPYLS